jgi:hypothetical protein
VTTQLGTDRVFHGLESAQLLTQAAVNITTSPQEINRQHSEDTDKNISQTVNYESPFLKRLSSEIASAECGIIL